MNFSPRCPLPNSLFLSRVPHFLLPWQNCSGSNLLLRARRLDCANGEPLSPPERRKNRTGSSPLSSPVYPRLLFPSPPPSVIPCSQGHDTL